MVLKFQMLGEHIYPLVQCLENEHAGKVTGMLLEMDQTEVLHLIESPDALKKKVAEAMDVLRVANTAAASDVAEISSWQNEWNLMVTDLYKQDLHVAALGLIFVMFVNGDCGFFFSFRFKIKLDCHKVFFLRFS